MGKITGLGHIGIFIKDVEVSQKFYEDVLGFECTCKFEDNGEKIAFVQKGDCVIELVQLVTPEDRKDGVVDHVALAVENLDEVQKELEAKGIVFETEVPEYIAKCFNGYRYLLFRGPDGEHLEIGELL